MVKELVMWIVDTVGAMGYPGIVALMFLESSFFPFPSEAVVPPAGYLAHRGEMDLALVILSGIFGSLLGALFNYWISMKIGRPFFERYGRYFFISPKALKRSEEFFRRHGHISTFTGRLMPVIRQYISLPAGIAKMPLGQFCIFTAAGAGIWVAVLAFAGYWLGGSPDTVSLYLHRVSIVLAGGCILLAALYAFRLCHRSKKGGQK